MSDALKKIGRAALLIVLAFLTSGGVTEWRERRKAKGGTNGRP